MNYDYKLPLELESLERELATRSTLQPAAELRHKITSSIHNRLRRESRLDFWRFAAAAALFAGVWLNLSLSAASQTDYHFQLTDERQSVEKTTRQIKKLLPEMSEAEARREALVLCTGVNLPMYPKITVPPGAIHQNYHVKD
jgi:hypothetical protein